VKIGLYAALTGLLIALPVLASEPLCTSEYERGRREIAAWAEMAGVMEGVIYGHSLALSPAKFCLSGMPKEQVQAIASAFSSDSYKANPVLIDDVPTREQAQQFLERFFPANN
jgi:hypothetical protein